MRGWKMTELEEVGIDDKFVDNIVDEILNSLEKDGGKLRVYDLQKRNLADVARLKARIVNLENRVEKYIGNFKVSSVEVERELSESRRNLEDEYDSQMMHMQTQMENLRTAMIKLSAEVNKIKDILSPVKTG